MSPSDPNVSGGSTDSILVECRYDEETPPSIAIVRAIAVIEDVDVRDFASDLGISLYDHLDPEALDRLVTENGDTTSLAVDLTFHDGYRYAVEILDTGAITVEKVD